MKCRYCGKEWKTESRILTNCPFCGALLPAVQITDNEITMASVLKRIVSNFGEDVVLDQRRCMSIFKDMAPQLKNEQKILETALKWNIGMYFVNCPEQEREISLQKLIISMNSILAESAQKDILHSFIVAMDWDENLLNNFYNQGNLKQPVNEPFDNNKMALVEQTEVYVEDSDKIELVLSAQIEERVIRDWDLEKLPPFSDFEEWLYGTYGSDFYIENDNYGSYNNRVAFYLKGDTVIDNYIVEAYLKDRTLVLKATIFNGYLFIYRIFISDKKLDFANNRRKLAHVTFVEEQDDYLEEDCEYLKKIISHLALAREQKKEVQRRIKDWYCYVTLLEEKAKEEDVYLDYSGYQFSNDFKDVEFIISDSSISQLSKKKHLYNATVQFREYSDIDFYDHDEQDDDSDYENIGKYVKYKPSNSVVVVELDDECSEKAEQNKLVLPENGKLFISNLGDLAQAHRLQNGLKQLENGKAKNPNLENVLFAEKVIVDNVDNQYSFDESTMLMKELNFSQRKAVQGALKAKDLFLIQGPPGTGKTTVIAEICYQNASKKLKTLVASQSNLAVDNALSKLKVDPKIRILRKGNASRVEEEGIDFTEDRVIDRWLQDTSDLCAKEADTIRMEYRSQKNEWEKLKDDLKEAEDKIERNEKELELKTEYLTLSKLINNVKYLKEQIVKLNSQIKPFKDQQNENSKELENIRNSISEKMMHQQGLNEKLKAQESKDQEDEGELEKYQKEKNDLEKLLNSYADVKNEFEKNKKNLEIWEKTLKQINDKHETYGVLANMVNEKEKNKNLLEWFQMTYPVDANKNVVTILTEKNRRVVELTNSLNGSVNIETNAEKIAFGLKEFVSYANSIVKNIYKFEQVTANTIKDAADKLENYSNNLMRISNNYKQGKAIDMLYKHLADVANDFDIDIRFIVSETKTNHNNTKKIEELRTLAENVMLEKPGKMRRLLGFTGSWKQRFRDVMSKTIGIKQTVEQEKAELLKNVNIDNCLENLRFLYQTCLGFYQQILPREIENVQNKIGYAEIELKRIGFDNQEGTILSTFKDLDKKVGLTKKSIQSAKENLKYLVPLFNEKQAEIQKLTFNPNERIDFLKNIILSISSKLNKLRKEKKEIDEELKKTKNEIVEFHNKESSTNEEIERLDKIIVPLENELRNTKDNYKQAEQRIIDLGYDAYVRLEELKSEIEQKEYDLKRSQEQIDDVASQSQNKSKDLEELKKSVDELKKKIPVLKRKITMETPERKMNSKLQRLKFIESWMQRIQNPKSEEKRGLKQLYIDQANVIGITCVQSGSKAFTQDYPDFDVVIIDEVSKATPPELLLPMLKAKKLILVGDHKQLPPMIGDDTLNEVVDGLDYDDAQKEETKKYFKTSVFEKLFEAASIPDENKETLVVQYRMHRYIMDTINQFYKDNETGGLICGIDDNIRNHGFNCRYIKPSDHVLWYNFPIIQGYREAQSDVSKSYYNDAEIDQVMKILLDMNEDIIRRKTDNVLEKEYKKSVGVISFYAEQIKRLKLKIHSRTELRENLSIRIGTVDRFQGMERDIIIASFVRNNNFGNIGFAKEFRRVNVALSRARELLVIVGCADLFCNPDNNRNKEAAEMYDNVLQQIRLHDGFRNSAGMTI